MNRRMMWLASVVSVWAAAGAGADSAVTVHLALPEDALPADVRWGIKRDGRLLAEGRAEVADPSTQLTLRPTQRATSASLTDGTAALLLCINRDHLDSYNPSFGELYQRIPIWITDGRARAVAALQDWHQRTLNDPANLLTIHYHRYDGNYMTAGLWTWDEQLARTPAQQEVFAVGRDAYGAIFQLDTSRYGDPEHRIGLLPRRRSDWRFKDGGDRFWDPSMGNEVFLLQGSNGVFTAPPDTSPKLVGATLDGPRTITVRFTNALPVSALDGVSLRDDAGEVILTDGATPADRSDHRRARVFVMKTRQPLALVGGKYRITVPQYPPLIVQLGRALAGDPFRDSAARLGAFYAPTGTTFGVFAPTAERVEVLVADALNGGTQNRHPLTRNVHGVWAGTVPHDLAGRFYAYRLAGPGLDAGRDVPDIYATCAQGLADRSLIIDPGRTNPPGFDPTGYVHLASPVDAVVYELHIRDMTSAANSGARHKGKYLGLTETGTRLPGDPSIRTGLDHLVELGVTHVHLLPVQDFENDESADRFNWGYMTVFFNTPEGMYATTPMGDARIRELKQLVKACHDHGIGVVLDVAYNHASSRYSSFERTVPGYYFRRRPDGSYWNGSGCGNEFQSEYPMVRKFIVDSLAYWVQEYGVDGFRFDLLGLTDLETLAEARRELRQINPSILLYGEPWTGAESGIARVTDKQALRGSGIAAFNDHFRDAIKGDRDGGAPGFIQNGDRHDHVRQGIAGAIHDWATAPTDVVTYCAAHDNLTLWDKIRQAAPDAPLAVQKRMQRFAGLLVLTSQGIAFLQAGQELCRTKGGNHNSYDAPDSVNQIDWSLKRDNRDVFDYYKGLIALRTHHPMFRLRTRDEVEKRLRFLDNTSGPRFIAYTLDGRGLPGESLDTALVLLNGDTTDRSFTLPPGSWMVFADADRAGNAALTDVSESLTLPPHSGTVLGR